MRRFSNYACSTAHLPLAEREAIDLLIRTATQRQGRIVIEHPSLSIEAHQYGFAVHLGLFDDLSDRPDDISPELWTLMNHARRMGANWLWFDRDERPSPAFPVFPAVDGEGTGATAQDDTAAVLPPPGTITQCCRSCGGSRVMRDAWAHWDESAQGWTLGAVFDAAYCEDCEADALLVERPVDTKGTAV
ncbi:hypothetical protein [Novosphingobium album (ex Liu et al. 2023)]|uniref:DUF5983 domain-containing protein n=1 Tax=Novosphingobium album (ex Liu et al. 2023) TaxID=3031130 RepID=A0ABT5WQ18_9SPHN|nr:hypothetical protein [Novosphingobium album (ex Liu et al. 2023)]MDE8652146.1 hypothetical protein [Novosphingobium album (ex Liu et al. 2023)]